MWMYYRDVTLYALGFSLVVGFIGLISYDELIFGILNMLVIFGIFGTGLGVLAFNYFQKEQYDMYHNLGFTKTFLIARSYLVNFCIAVVMGIILSLFI